MCSIAPSSASTTTGTSVAPASRQAARRLNPSITSKRPPSLTATRMGNAAANSLACTTVPGRRGRYVVSSRSTGTMVTTLGEGMSGEVVVTGTKPPDVAILMS